MKVFNRFKIILLNTCASGIHNPKEVKAQADAHVGSNKGYKVDYALKIDGNTVILIEVKGTEESLYKNEHWGQLYKYFTSTENRDQAEIAILTNGIEAWFYSDFTDRYMDEKPFFKFNFQESNYSDTSFLKLFCKNGFSLEKIKEHAQKLQIVDEVEKFIETNIINPSKDFTKFVMNNVLSKDLRKKKHNKKIVESALANSMQANKSTVESIDNSPIRTVTDPLTASITTSQSETTNSRELLHQEPSPEVEKPTDPRALQHQYPSPQVENLYKKYSNGIKEIADGISENSRKFYFTYKKNNRKPFCSLQRRLSSIQINLYLNNIEVLDNHIHGCANHEGKGHLGGGSHHVDIDLNDNNDDNKIYDYIMKLIKLAYDKA